MQVVEKQPAWLLPLYAAVLVVLCLTFGIGVFALTVEPDEVWNLMSTMKAFGLPLPATSAVNYPVTTTGGLHFVLHGLVAIVRSGDIVLHRAVSVAITLLLLAIVFSTVASHLKNRVLAAAGTALFAVAPGFLLQASLATSEIIATTVMLLAALFWFRFGSRSASYAALGGVLFGVACATRMTCLSMLPAILIWSIFMQRGWLARVVLPALAVTFAVAVFLGLTATYFAAFGDTPWSEFMVASSSASGVSRAFPGLMLRLNYLAVSDGILPLAGMVALSGWLLHRASFPYNEQGLISFCALLLLTGGAGWLAWLLKAPIPHIRYLWPALPLIWLAIILLGLSELHRVKQAKSLAIAHLTIICICAGQVLLNARMLAVGDSLTLVYEAARRTELGTPRQLFEVRKHQQAMADLLAGLPQSATVHALAEPAAYPMTYLSGRTITSLAQAGEASAPRYLLVQAYDRSIWPTSWDRISWLQNNAKLEVRHGDYWLYRIRADAGQPVQ